MDNSLNNLRKTVAKLGDKISDKIGKHDPTQPLVILLYRSFASKTKLFVKGRVLEDENIFFGKSDSKIRNIINNFKRFETDEIPRVPVRIKCRGEVFDCVTDAEGYFTLDTDRQVPIQDNSIRTLKIQAELRLSKSVNTSGITAEGQLFLPSEAARFGIITDIDDTILQTHVSSLFRLRMLYTTFFKNARQRLPMEGMVELMQQFAAGEEGANTNPVFYLSHSPWNIYDLLEEFLDLQNFPRGPILLRDFGLAPAGEFSKHKISSISRILNTYPDLPFILLGDSADEDADFYLEAAERFPDRIRAIYIRQTGDTKNARRIKRLIENTSKVHAVLVNSSDEIHRDAIELGLI